MEKLTEKLVKTGNLSREDANEIVKKLKSKDEKERAIGIEFVVALFKKLLRIK